MFLDSSAILAILLEEDDAHHYLARIDAASSRVYTSPIARFEAISSLARAKAPLSGVTPELVEAATGIVDRFLGEIPAQQVVISADIGQRAIEASTKFGKIVGHRASLNLGDCFAYASAQTYRLPLLYKDDGFSETDIKS